MQKQTRATPGAPETHIWRKPQARHLWFRFSVPTRFRHLEPSRLIQRDLKTNDMRQARVLKARMIAELFDRWERQQPGEADVSTAVWERITPTAIDLQIAAFEGAFTHIRSKLDVLIRSKSLTGVDAYQAYIGSLRQQLLRLIQTRESEAMTHWRKVADREIGSRGWNLASDSDLYREFVGMIADASIEALRVEIEVRSSGDQSIKVSTVIDGARAKAERCIEGEGIIELFEKYAAQRLKEGRKRPDTVNQDRKVVQLFSAFVGADRSLKSISAAEVRNWRDTIGAIPPSYRKRKGNQGLTIREAAAKAKAEGCHGLSLATLNKYLSTISPLFDWGRHEGYVDHNPCDGLFYGAAKGKNARPPFDPTQLNLFLQSPLFTGFLREGREYERGQERADDWRFWIPLLCIFTGARLGEIAQLRVEDVAEEWGVWCLHIRHEEKAGQTTKSGHSRHAVLHSKLIAMGFLAFADRQRDRAKRDGDSRLFHEIIADNRGQLSRMPSRFLRNYLSKIGIKDGGDGFGAHSFRHTLADQLRGADYLDNQIGVVLGHSQKSVTGGYGRVRQGTVRMMKEMIEAASFEGVDFDHLIDNLGR